MEKNFEYRSGS